MPAQTLRLSDRQLKGVKPASKDYVLTDSDGLLTGSHATRQRHLLQAKVIQAKIAERWQQETPWRWQKKHVVWFLDTHLKMRSEATRYHYLLTVRLIALRLEKPWIFNYLNLQQHVEEVANFEPT